MAKTNFKEQIKKYEALQSVAEELEYKMKRQRELADNYLADAKIEEESTDEQYVIDTECYAYEWYEKYTLEADVYEKLIENLEKLV
jgi:hypothetical protein